MRPHVKGINLQYAWLWSIAGSIVVWILIGIISSQFSFSSLTINAELASFLVIVALGQMFVITGGAGGIDLSIPFVMTFSAFLSASIMNGHDSATVPGLLAGIGAGLLFGTMNAFIVLAFRIPPIVATLSVGFIADSATNVYTSKVLTATPSPMLQSFVHDSTLGIPWIVLLALGLVVCSGILLQRMVSGRYLEATGQSEQAARLSGVRTWRVRAGAYLASGTLAGLGGVLIAGYSGGAFLRMGDPYLLASIGAVVLGGSLIAGGKSTAVGTFGGALFLTLVTTLIEVTKQAIGLQYVIEGLIIIAVLLASNQTQRA